MQVVHTVQAVRKWLESEPRVAFVPTMGNLHDGHLSLVEVARQHADFVVVSIFVNRLQFEPGGDFERYPRTLAEDCARLEAAGVDVVFAPDEAELYPEPQEVLVEPPASLAAELEGAHRPGHFRGMATVVLKLLNIVQPQAAVFGKKDYQQLKIVEALVRQLNLPVRIVPGETVRAPDGLALSSRNGYLTREQRAEAVRLNRNLSRIRGLVQQGRRDFAVLEREAAEDLARHGWRVDYVAVRQKSLLQSPAESDRDLVVLGAAWLGTTRLIDNVEIEAG